MTPERVLLELLAELAEHLESIPTSWESAAEAEAEELLRAAIATLVETFRTHGRLLRALADEATRDAEVERRYLELGARLSGGVAERIARDVADGRSALSDPEEVATALVWMNERFLQQRFARDGLAPHPLPVLSAARRLRPRSRAPSRIRGFPRWTRRSAARHWV